MMHLIKIIAKTMMTDDDDDPNIGYIPDLSMQREGIIRYKKMKFLDNN